MNFISVWLFVISDILFVSFRSLLSSSLMHSPFTKTLNIWLPCAIMALGNEISSSFGYSIWGIGTSISWHDRGMLCECIYTVDSVLFKYQRLLMSSSLFI